MKKLLLLLLPLMLIILLAGCSQNKTVNCTNAGESLKIVYNKDKIIEVYENGVKAKSEEIEQANSLIVSLYGSVENYIETLISSVELGGGTCSR